MSSEGTCCDSNNVRGDVRGGGWSPVKVLEKFKFCNSGILKMGQPSSSAKKQELCDTGSCSALPAGFVLLVVLIGLSGMFTIIMWFTELYMFQVLQFVTIAQGSASYDMWQNSPVKPYVSIYPFNYTNIDRVLEHGDTPVVQELGPFVYRETVERINVEFHANGTITYQERRSNEFVRDLSQGDPKLLTITVPNLPLITALSQVRAVPRGSFSYIISNAMSMSLDLLLVKPFLNLNVDEYFWGYEDNMYALTQNLASTLHREARLSKFGIITGRRGVSPDRITIHGGVGNLDKLGVITRYNGRDALNVWKTNECNRLDGSDGSQFPPTSLSRRSKLYVFQMNLCRRFPLVYKEDMKTMPGVNAFRFQPPRNVFDTPNTNPDNECYHGSGTFLPSGVFNSSPCNDAPIMMSFPHFYLGDPQLRRDVLGLSPNPDLHETYVDVHSKLGVSLGGRSRFQVNIMLKKSVEISHFKHIKQGTILPVAWIEVKVDKLPDDIRRSLQQASISIDLGEILLKWTSLLTLTLSMVFLVRKIILKDCNEKLILPMNK